MKNTNNGNSHNHSHKQAETLKKSIHQASQKSKEAIKSLIDANSKQFDSALETNTKTFDSISKMLYEKEMDPSIVSGFKTAFGNGVKLSEDTIDSIVDSYTEGLDLSIDFVSKFSELVKNEDLSSKKGMDMLVELVKDHFDKSSELSISNMEKMIAVYNDHLNLALNFNKKFADNISSQVEAMFKLQKKNFDAFYSMEMVNDWWKSYGKERAKV
jgi:hypothetical protein